MPKNIKSLNKEWKRKIALANLGKKRSDETKGKMRIAHLGKPTWITNHNHPKYEEWKQASIIAGKKKKGKHYSPETEFKEGHKMSEETLKKQSEKKKGITYKMRYGDNAESMKKLKGRTYEDIYGKEKADILRKQRRDYKYTEEDRRKISISKIGKKLSMEHKKKFLEGRMKVVTPIMDSSIEVKIQGFLKQLGIEFYPHQYIKIEHGYQCDIFIPSMNLIIECDGDYWHGNPRRYLFPSRDQAEQIMEDVVRTKELQEAGYKVLRLWECDIKNMKIKEFKVILQEAIT